MRLLIHILSLALTLSILVSCKKSEALSWSPQTATSCGVFSLSRNFANCTLSLSALVSTIGGFPDIAGYQDSGSVSPSQFSRPEGIASDGLNLYIADTDHNMIRKIVIATGLTTTLANPSEMNGSNDGPGSVATFWGPSGLATDGVNLYVADVYNHTIRQIVIATGYVSTLAGVAGANGVTDGVGAAAHFDNPIGLVLVNGNLYISELTNNKIRKLVISTKTVSTVAGTGTAGYLDGAGAVAQFYNPIGLTTDGFNLYIADLSNNVIRVMNLSSNVVSTLAGNQAIGGSSDGIGSSATFDGPWGMSTDGTYLYVSDYYSHILRKINISNQSVTTIAGTAGVAGTADGYGVLARFSSPAGLVLNGDNIFLTDYNNHSIRKVDLSNYNSVTTFSGTPGSLGDYNSVGANTLFQDVSSISSDGKNLYITDTSNNMIRQLDISSGKVTTLAGSLTPGSIDGVGINARFNSPMGITSDGFNLFIADTSNFIIRKMNLQSKIVTTLAGSVGVSGSNDGIGVAAKFGSIFGLATDGVYLYICDADNNTIKKINISSKQVTTIAGSAGVSGSTDGVGSIARFVSPAGITINGDSLYIADTA